MDRHRRSERLRCADELGVAAIGVAPYPYRGFGRAENAVLSSVGALVIATTGVRALAQAPEGGPRTWPPINWTSPTSRSTGC